MGRDIKYLTIAVHTQTHIHYTHNSWWLVLGWVTTKEDHPRLRFIASLHAIDIWRVTSRVIIIIIIMAVL